MKEKEKEKKREKGMDIQGRCDLLRRCDVIRRENEDDLMRAKSKKVVCSPKNKRD